MSQTKLARSEIQCLLEASGTDYRSSSIRLREGEYQYDLAKAIASFQLNLHFPDVKDIITRLYGEGKTSDIQFVRKIQTILKKMEKSNIVKILPKKTPWELQRYTLSGFKFEDNDKNLVALATDEQIEQMQKELQLITSEQKVYTASPYRLKAVSLMLIVIVSYVAIVWAVVQAIVNPFVFAFAFSIAVASSLLLGRTLSRA